MELIRLFGNNAVISRKKVPVMTNIFIARHCQGQGYLCGKLNSPLFCWYSRFSQQESKEIIQNWAEMFRKFNILKFHPFKYIETKVLNTKKKKYNILKQDIESYKDYNLFLDKL